MVTSSAGPNLYSRTEEQIVNTTSPYHTVVYNENPIPLHSVPHGSLPTSYFNSSLQHVPYLMPNKTHQSEYATPAPQPIARTSQFGSASNRSRTNNNNIEDLKTEMMNMFRSTFGIDPVGEITRGNFRDSNDQERNQARGR